MIGFWPSFFSTREFQALIQARSEASVMSSKGVSTSIAGRRSALRTLPTTAMKRLASMRASSRAACGVEPLAKARW
jgi:hypothetical protein